MATPSILPQWAIDKFWKHANPREGDECWIWGASCHGGSGYAIVLIPHALRDGANYIKGSHVSLILDGRPRPDKPNHYALHGDCSDPKCVNPKHLRWGSQAENMLDRKRLKRGANNRGILSARSVLTFDDLAAIWVDPRRYRFIAADYGVSDSVISHIKTKRKYHDELALIEGRFGEAVKPPHSSVR